MHLIPCALTFPNAESSSMPANIAMMAITTSNSIAVNPSKFLRTHIFILTE
ncbi:MAG: hypothetical protein M2R45_02877 [Verrucomicrobia subdivision 3 bacterium]|nr:hypothetical protein [Limisphaerales bacterium]MCS1414729.1 hypothetical protein [Limisphaerales bacterium]